MEAVTVASMATRLAQGAVTELERRWKDHKKQCHDCHPPTRHRPAKPCRFGVDTLRLLQAARDEARKELEADRAPNPDQQTLF